MMTAVYIIVMAGVTYLIRMIPFTFFRRKIRSRFFRSFLYYIPYAVLTAMTVPAIFHSTNSIVTAAVGTAAALILAYFGLPLIVVALSASLAVYITGSLL
ncbi:MAG TPA: branched-chain amino acid transporter [Ruminococcus sp.]|nr:branched-chain amino acid transporter [Ruminococcus sp.]